MLGKLVGDDEIGLVDVVLTEAECGGVRTPCSIATVVLGVVLFDVLTLGIYFWWENVRGT